MLQEKTLKEIKGRFEELSELRGLQSEIKKTVDGPVLIIYVSYISDRFYSILTNAIKDIIGDEQSPGAVAALKRLPQSNLVDGPEARLLVKTLSESQNVSRHSFRDDFFERYTKSVTGAEEQIVSKANHIVFGRRGAGKSMLLLYGLNRLARSNVASAWVDMQLYNGRNDEGVYADVVAEIVRMLPFPPEQSAESADLLRQLETDLPVAQVRRLLPRIKRVFASISSKVPVYLYLDDFHVIDKKMQPILLDIIYAFSRGNQVYIKISAIETLTKTYESVGKIGLEVPQDVQVLRLDHNLTSPDKAAQHLEAILDSHARYAGLPNIRRLCSSADVLPRLTWVSAGVPRDAMNLFSQAILRASSEGKKRVTVSNVNMASSETLTVKLRDLEVDASDQATELKGLLYRIRDFCVAEKRKNAFLIEISAGSELYGNVIELVQMRLLHVISEGITPGDAGKKFTAIILDYGLYTGIRAAQSVELFNQKTEKPSYKELRSLPIYRE